MPRATTTPPQHSAARMAQAYLDLSPHLAPRLTPAQQDAYLQATALPSVLAVAQARDGRDLLEALAREALSQCAVDTFQACLRAMRDRADCAKLVVGLEALYREEAGLFAPVNPETRQAPPRSPAFAVTANKVAYVSYATLPFHSTGYANRTHELARGLRQAGLDVDVIARPGYPWDEPANSLSAAHPVKRDQVITRDGVSYHFTPGAWFGDWDNHAAYCRQSTVALTALFRRLKPAVVIAASNHACAGPALLAARALGLPFVHEVRGFWEDSRAAREPGFPQSAQYRLEAHLDGDIARQADLVATLGPAMARRLVARGVPETRLITVPNGARNTPPPCAIDLPFADDVPVIGYVGSFSPYEGLEVLIDACTDLARAGVDFGLALIGDGRGSGAPPNYAELLRARCRAQGIADRVFAPGRVAPDSARAYVDALDIVAYPRLRREVTETVTPLKPAEAMMAGRAIVASDVGGFDGMLEDRATALRVPAGDVRALKDSLAHLLRDADLRSALGTAARDRAMSAFDWSKICAQYAERLAPLMQRAAKGEVSVRDAELEHSPRAQKPGSAPTAPPEFAAMLGHLAARLDDQQTALVTAQETARQFEIQAQTAQHMRESLSWRITRPLRQIKRGVTRLTQQPKDTL